LYNNILVGANNYILTSKVKIYLLGYNNIIINK